MEAGFNISGGNVVHNAVVTATNYESNNSHDHDAMEDEDEEEYNDESYEGEETIDAGNSFD